MPALQHGEHALILLKQMFVLFHRVAQLADIAFQAFHQLLLICLQMFFSVLKYLDLAIEVLVHLIDEILTPDSSRFWPADSYAVGKSPPSYDKQFVRDYLETLDWDKTAPGPALPADVAARTAEKYQEAWRRLTQG